MKNLFSKLFSGIALAALVLVPSQSLLPTANATTGSAIFNRDPQDFPVLEVSNYTRCPNSSACWSSSISGVKAGETIAFILYAHNTGDADAANTRVSINITGGGSTLNAYGRITADNASAVARNVQVYMDPSVTTPVSLTYLGGEYYKQSSLSPNTPDALPGGQTVSQVTQGGVNIGTLPKDAPGNYDNDMQLVMRFRVEGGNPVCSGTPVLQVSPNSNTVTAGQTAQYRAIYDSNGSCEGGQSDVTSSATWTTDNTSIATSNGSGVIRGNVQGNTTVRASYSGLSSSAVINVTQDNTCSGTATLMVTPASDTVRAGQTTQYRAIYDSNGNCDGGQTDVTNSASWSTGNTGIASSNGSGVIRGNAQGSTSVTARYNNLSGVASINVTQDNTCSGNATLVITPYQASFGVGTTYQYRALYDADGPGCAGAETDVTNSASWNTNSSAIASNQGTGIFRGIAAGSTGITANYAGLNANAIANVTGGNTCTGTATLEINPSRDTINVDEVAEYEAIYDSNGDCAGGRTDVTRIANWTLDSTSVAINLDDGEFRGRRDGTTAIRASYNGVSDEANLRVRDNDDNDNDDDYCDRNGLETLVITPYQASFGVGQSYQYRALYDADGPGCSGGERDVTNDASWSTNGSSIVSNQDDGRFRGVNGGTAGITARYSGISATAIANVIGSQIINQPPQVIGGGTIQLPPTYVGGGTVQLPPTYVGGGTIQLPPTVIGGGTIVQQPTVAGAVTSGVAAESVACITVTPSVDVSSMLPGQDFVYTTLYRNDCPFALNNAVLRVFIPNDVEFIASSNPFFIREGQKFSYNLGVLPPGGQGSVAISGYVRKDARIGDTETFTSSIEFLDSTNRIQGTTSYLVAVLGGDIRRTFTANLSDTLGHIFGSGWFWIVIFLLVLAGIIAFIAAMLLRRRAYHPVAAPVVVAAENDPLRALRNA